MRSKIFIPFHLRNIIFVVQTFYLAIRPCSSAPEHYSKLSSFSKLMALHSQNGDAIINIGKPVMEVNGKLPGVNGIPKTSTAGSLR